ncbi:MAG: lytic murein transglycosylase [Solirubrobacterales bacterium]|nr:lytic murein transglycosylase [Solirubrobacterales bacterium]
MSSPTTLRRRLLPALCLVALGLPGAARAEEASAPVSAPAPQTEPAPPGPPSEATVPSSTTTSPAPEAVPQVQTQLSQGSSPGGSARKHVARPSPKNKKAGAGAGAKAGEGSPPATRAKQKAVAPSALTPLLPAGLQGSISGVPGFFIESFRIPPFLLPIYQAAGTAYGIPWQVLAAINEVETDYGRDLSVSSAGAEGWMQFLPSSWAQYGVDANGDGFRDPYNPADAIFAAARYLRAAGGDTNIKAGIFSYNHSQAYVESVMLRAQLLGGTPSELLGAITGLTEAHFPVHAAAHFSDGFPTVQARGSGAPTRLVGTTIDAAAGAPVVAVQDGEIVQIGHSAALGRFVVLRDAFGNTYTYAQLGDVARVYPVLQPHVHSTVSARITGAAREPVPSGPATAGAQPRSPMSDGATVSGLSLGAVAGLEASAPAAPAQPAPPVVPVRKATKVRSFRAGANDVYLHPLSAGAQVIAGTVLGHLAAPSGAALAADPQPHLLFQVRPAGAGAPLIDPKPILDGWVALENTSIFHAKGENPFLATSPTIGQVLLESKQQLGPQVLHDGGIHLSRCGRQDVQAGRVDKRVLTMLEYLSVSGMKPTVAGLRCTGAAQASLAANTTAGASSTAVDITAVNGVAVAGHQGQGSITDDTVRKLLGMQGLSRPQRITSLLGYQGAKIAHASPRARDAIHVAFSALGAPNARLAGLGGVLSPAQWIKLTARLGEIPDPTVGRGPSAAAIPVHPGANATGAPRGNG